MGKHTFGKNEMLCEIARLKMEVSRMIFSTIGFLFSLVIFLVLIVILLFLYSACALSSRMSKQEEFEEIIRKSQEKKKP